MIQSRRFITRKSIVVILLFTGVILLIYALLNHSSKAVIPGWVPVNAPLQEALLALESSHDSKLEVPEGHVNEGGQATPQLTSNTTDLQQDSIQTAPPIMDKNAIAAPNLTNNSSPEPEQLEDHSALIDLNKATQAELETLPGIGPSKAGAIIAYREKNNGFREVEQLLEVKGIGEKMLERVIALVRVTP